MESEPPVPSKPSLDQAASSFDIEGSPSPTTLTPPRTKDPTAFLKEAATHSTMLIAGWSDASSGPLIPYIQARPSPPQPSLCDAWSDNAVLPQVYYGISYSVVSMLFVGQMVGFISAGFSNSWLTERYGLGRVIALGALIQALGYVFLIPAFPFPVMPICYAVIGFGMALQDAQANTYVATLPNSEQKFGYLHASYGVGALVCPLAATAFASRSGVRFSFFYGISIALATINLVTLLWAFKFNYRIDWSEGEGNEEVMEMKDVLKGKGAEGGVVETLVKDVGAFGGERKVRGPLAQTLRNKMMWLSSIFILVYVGAEVSMGGWIISFLVDERQGGPSSGYVATGFWGGITLGRAFLPRFNIWVGERRVVWIYCVIALCLEFAIMYSSNLVGNAIVVALIGVMMGCLYPITMHLCTKQIPRSLHSSALGFIAAFGQTGSAIFPFMTGALAQKYTPAVLQPVMISLFVVLCGLWFFVPVAHEGDKEE